MLVVRFHCFSYPLALYSKFREVVILIAVFSQRCSIIGWMVALLKLMYCFFSNARASLPTPYRRSSFPASCAPRYLVYADYVSLCFAAIWPRWATLTPAVRAATAYASGLTSAAYTQTGSKMTIWCFSSGMTHARYPHCCPLMKWVDFITLHSWTVLKTSLLLCFWRGRMFDVKIVNISQYLLNLWLSMKLMKRILTNYGTIYSSYG